MLISFFRFALIGFFCFNPVVFQAQDSIHNKVDIVPIFEGCADPLISAEQQQRCSTNKILDFVNRHVTYPDSAKNKGVEGVVVIRFLVDSTGKVTHLELVRDLGAGCGDEALRVMRLLPSFTPARKEGKAVATKMTLPIRFKAIRQDASAPENFYQLHWGTAYSDLISQEELVELQKQAIVVRDYYGNLYDVHTLEMSYILRSKVKTEKSKSNSLSPNMVKLLEKAKPKSVITFSAKIKKGVQNIEVFREFEIKEPVKESSKKEKLEKPKEKGGL